MPAADLPLRDIHLPPPPGWWPPAIGWWLLLALLLILISLWLWRRKRRQVFRRPVPLTAARQALQRVETEYAASGDAAALVRDLSALLRQTCLALYPRTETASLTGEGWLDLLDRPLAQPGFRQGPGRILVDGPYQPEVALDSAALVELIHAWLDALQATPTGDGDAAA